MRRIYMDYKDAISVIESNYPSENCALLREALDLAIGLLEEKSDNRDSIVDEINSTDNIHAIPIDTMKKSSRNFNR